MIQDFSSPSDPSTGPGRLETLRKSMADHGLDGFWVPRADRHQGEWVAPRDERLAWLTGFTGSAGFCIALRSQAGVFVDGRYRVQVRVQTDPDAFTPVDWPEVQPGDWLKQALPGGGKIGFDPWLHTKADIARVETALKDSGITLVPGPNLIDAIWTDQPDAPSEKAVAYPAEFAGVGDEVKRAGIAADLVTSGQRAAVLTLPDSICWLLNIRGSDVARTPIVHAFAILHDDARVILFSDPAKFTELAPDPAIDLLPWANFETELAKLTGPVRVDPATAPLAISTILDAAGIEIAAAQDPCILPKACKNPVEIAGTAEAHLRDGAAMAEFLCWLDGQEPGQGLSEIDIVTRLEHCRMATNALRDLSFDTICGSGPNGALPHYRVSTDSNRSVESGDLIVIDSGGQYFDGTTDITRTVCLGTPSDQARRCFTLVLKGVIAISRARWPRGLSGRDLDPLARAALWAEGLDFDHGTGHGVGHYLGVHEGPQRISRLSEIALQPGMILSNEPGYYREGAFGIRTENLVVVQEANDIPGSDGRDQMAFRTLTFAPIQRHLIDADLLSSAEKQWLDAYHAQVLNLIGPRVGPGVQTWLKTACAPI